jgi:hypothetical protein
LSVSFGGIPLAQSVQRLPKIRAVLEPRIGSIVVTTVATLPLKYSQIFDSKMANIKDKSLKADILILGEDAVISSGLLLRMLETNFTSCNYFIIPM